MKKLLTTLVLGVALLSGGAGAQVAGNPGTKSQYFVGMNPTTEKFELCWADAHGHGNCMAVGDVFELIRQSQMAYEQEQLDSAI